MKGGGGRKYSHRRPRPLVLPPIITVSTSSSEDRDTGEDEPMSGKSSSAPSSPCASVFDTTHPSIPPAPLSERSLGLMKRGSSKGSTSSGFASGSIAGQSLIACESSSSVRRVDSLDAFDDFTIPTPRYDEDERKKERRTTLQRLAAAAIVCVLIITFAAAFAATPTSVGGSRPHPSPEMHRRPILRSTVVEQHDRLAKRKNDKDDGIGGTVGAYHAGFGLALAAGCFIVARRKLGQGRYMHIAMDAEALQVPPADTSMKTPSDAQRKWWEQTHAEIAERA